ncbi:proton-conducting transporter membrane subunit [Candidatus Acidianus copahuensis]|nr:proton-conducting transporter membrane subunit [Candidatus Acidianus copahuensis]
MIISIIIASFTFFLKGKWNSFVSSIIAILINSYFLVRLGSFEKFYVTTDVGDFGFTVNDLNFAFLIVILSVTAVTAYYSTRYMEERFAETGKNWGLYFGLYSLFAVSMMYVVLSINLLEIYVFLEISLITSFLLIMLYGYGDRRRISLMYFIWTHVGTILLLASIILIGIETGTMNIYSSFSTFYHYSTIPFSLLIFISAIIGMMVKGAQAGFNIWLPYAHGEAPTPISILLSPNLVGLGIFVIIIYYYLFPIYTFIAGIFIIWAIITMIYGGLNAISQKDFKRFLAYSTVSQMGYMLLGSSIAYLLGLPNNAIALPLGILASILIYAGHGFGKAILFMSAGASITELHERNVDNLGGLYMNSSLHSSLSFIGVLNLLGMPPTVGFFGEALLLLAVGETVSKIGIPLFIAMALFIAIGIGISSSYLAYLFKKVYGGKSRHDISMDKAVEYSIPMILMALLSMLFFFFPNILSSSLNNFITILSGTYYIPFLIVFLPAIGSLISLVTPRLLNQDLRGSIVVALIGISTALSAYNLYYTLSLPHTSFYVPVYEYTSFTYFSFSSSVLQALLALFVSGLSFFISVYSIGYMREDTVLRRYWGFFGFFVTSMLAVVLSDNLFLFLAGWEGTGLASYGLISYWLNDDMKNVVGDPGRKVLGVEYLSKPTTSGIRALVFTRVADVAMFLAFGYLLFLTRGSLFTANSALYSGVFISLSALSVLPFALPILILLYLGGLSKSAQFPFTQWLVTAMTGPTPVSALIHAATMVNLGIIFSLITYPFLVVQPVFAVKELLEIIIGVTAFTAIYTSLNALVSNEQKVILANSTADQISLAIFSVSLGSLLALDMNNLLFLYAGITAALIQMIAHGIYKASLFMNAGSVIHYTESRYVASFPNLYKKLKAVFILQLFAALNLANIPIFIGFWAHSFISYMTAYFPYIDILYLLLEFAGSIYIIRYVAKVFMYGKGEGHGEGHISSIMLVSPAILIAISIILVGVLGYLVSFFKVEFFAPSSLFVFNSVEFLASLVGIAIAFVAFTSEANYYRYLRPVIDFLYYGWYVYPLTDKFGSISFNAAQAIYRNVETGIIDSSLNVKLPRGIISYGSRLFSRIQTGVLRDYLGYYMAGLAIILLIILVLIEVL